MYQNRTTYYKACIDYAFPLMLNKTMKKTEFLLLFGIVLFVFLLYQTVTSLIYTTHPNINASDLINDETVSSQELYDKSWESVKKNYIDSTYNSQS